MPEFVFLLLAKVPGSTCQWRQVCFSLSRDQVHLLRLDVAAWFSIKSTGFGPKPAQVSTPAVPFTQAIWLDKQAFFTSVIFSVNRSNNTYLAGLLFWLDAYKTLHSKCSVDVSCLYPCCYYGTRHTIKSGFWGFDLLPFLPVWFGLCLYPLFATNWVYRKLIRCDRTSFWIVFGYGSAGSTLYFEQGEN